MVTLSDLYNEANTPGSPYKWWQSSCGEIELVIHIDDAKKGCHKGRCDADIADLLEEDYIKAQLNTLDPEAVAKEMREYFFDSDFDPECKDHENNKHRLLWIACGDIVENSDSDEEV